MKKILLVFGTRPEAVKMAPLVKKLKQYTLQFDTKVCLTGQHREMVFHIMELFEIKADFNLDIMKPGQDLYEITTGVLAGLKSVLESYKPDLVLVHGDTTTTFAASLAAFYKKIPIGHVEAGLRTDNIYSPWPEEGNRKLTDCLTQFNFVPTQNTKNNLLKENIAPDTITITGNTVIDALYWVMDKINQNGIFKKTLTQLIAASGFNQLHSQFILVTGHRRENFGQGLINICNAIKYIAESNPTVNIVYPVHLNPNVKEPVSHRLAGITNIFLIDPLPYEAFIYLMQNCYFILTDSGGIQEEAPSLGKPVLVMRDTTERPEAIAAGTARLVGSDAEKIIAATQFLLDNPADYTKMSLAHNPYGDGHAAEKIVQVLLEAL